MQADGYEQTDFESKLDQLQQKTAVFSTKKKPFPLIQFLKRTNVYFVYNCFANFILSGFLFTRFGFNHKWLFTL